MSFNTKAMQEALPSKQRPGKTYEDVCREYLSEVKIPEGDVKIENRPAPSPQRDSEVMVKTNMFRSVVKKVIPIYQYSVKMEGRRSDLSEWSVISEGSANDYFNMERREACRHLYVTARLYITDFEKAESHFYYDGRSTLYSVKKTNKPSISLKLTREQVVAGAALDPTKVADMVVLRGYNEFMVEITNVGDNGAENFSTDISTLLADENMELSNPQFVRFLDIATSQYVMDDRENHISFPNGISYFADPEQSGYNVDQLQQEHGIYFAPGISKSARLIRGQNDKVESAIVVQPKLSPFHNVESVVEKVGNLIDERSILPIVLGLYVYPVHLFYRETRPILRPFKITGLGPSANNIKFEYDGQTITVAKYFEKVHGRRLEFPHLPTVECKQQDKNRIYYPMEVCEILDNQRSSSSQVIDQLVKLAAIAPNVLDGRIRRCAEALNMNNEYMENAQIKVEENPIEIKAPLLPTPTLVYASKNSEFETDATRLTWQTGDYVKTPKKKALWALYSQSENIATVKEMEQFVVNLMNTSKYKKMYLSQPAEIAILNTVNTLEDRIQAAIEHDCKFIMLITNIKDKEIHESLKSYEQQHGVVTQNVTRRTLEGVLKGQRVTTENILNKTNMKMGGLNYTILPKGAQLKSSDLIIGLAINHPAGGRGELNSERSTPSVLGYAANDGKQPSEFTGDFFYQPATRGMHLETVHQLITDVVARYVKAHNDEGPQRIIIYQNGASEGDFASILRFVVPTIRHALKMFDGNTSKISLTFVVCSRLHNARFYPSNLPMNAKPKAQSLPNGVVIDKYVTNALYPEFYLASHCALQGTATYPRYTVLYNNSKMSMDELQRLSHALCFAHQIVNSPISSPAPVKIAEEYAKRGRNLFVARANPETPKVGGDPKALTKLLSYKKHDIREYRVNA